MDHRELKRLVRLMNENGLVELEIEREGLRVSLKKAGAQRPDFGAPVWPATAPGALPPLVPAATPGEPPPPAEPPGTRVIASPMVGTFYRRPSPDDEPYVDVGDTIDGETIVCIVEAMKVNNEIKAEMSGQIVEVLVEDGEPVEYDEPLFRVKVG